MFKKPSSSTRRNNLSQFGLIDVPDLDDGDDDLDLSDDDIDLEAELAAITGEGGKRERPKKRAPVPQANLDALIAESLKDVPSDEEVSGDDDDPELLSELKELAIDDDEAPTPVPPTRKSRPAPPPPSAAASFENSAVNMLQERISNYVIAERTAKENGDSMRARRFARGLKTLNDLLKQAKAGRPIKDEDIPPPVTIKKTEPAPQPPPIQAPSSPPVSSESPPDLPPRITMPEEPSLPEPTEPPPPPPTMDNEGLDPARQQGLQIILKRKEEFKAAALSSKRAGNKAMALEYLKVVKQFDIVVDAYKSGQEMDLNELPTPETIAAAFSAPEKIDDETQGAAAAPAPTSGEGGLITASTLDEALRQRLAAFQQQEKEAQEKGEAAKARRMGRIAKQYQDAIRLHAAGRPLPIDELPTPKGFAPLPIDNAQAAAAAPSGPGAPGAPGAPRAPRPSPPAVRPGQSSRYDKQLAFLLHRQKEFKEAALRAKKSGDIEQAKEYLRAAKGFDSVIEAAKGGLAVDLKSLPLPPQAKKQLDNTFDVVSAEDCTPPDDIPAQISLEDEDVMARLHQQLTSQLKLCLGNRDHYKAMGNVAETNRFEHLAVSVKQDLDVVTIAKRLGQNPPKFHYESRQFSVVQCNTDLNENDLELTIVRGIAYTVPNPKEVDTYVKFEFPYPQDAPVSDRTAVVKDTNSPEYNAVFPLVINRAARPCLRVFKRHGIKFEVYSRGGWFSRDSLLGAVTVKLAPLETQVTIHDAVPLMDGRRPAGGSLEVKLRVRSPLLHQQVENTTHRWLVLDH